MASNTIKTRIQLKNDTEANWDRAINFIPREGEVIIYTADDAHPFSRLKVGDGSTTVINLPFVGSHNINYAVAEGTASAITATISNFSLDIGTIIILKNTIVNNANATLNINNTGAKNIKYDNTAIAANSLKINKFYSFVYDGTDWQLIDELISNNFKTVQTAVTDPIANGNAISFIDTISQSINGDITVTKKTIPTADSSIAGITTIGVSGGAAAYNHNHNYVPLTDGVTNITWDTTNKKLVKTINDTLSDIVSIGTIKTALELSKTDVGLENVTNDEQIPKSIGTTAGDLIYWTAASTPARLGIGTEGQLLTMVSGIPTWQTFLGSDTKVTNIPRSGTLTKFWITGTKNSNQTIDTQVFDTSVYVTATAGELSALSLSIHDTSTIPVEKVHMVWNSTDESLDFIFN